MATDANKCNDDMIQDAYWPTENKLDFGGLTIQQMICEEGDGDSEGVVVRQVEVDWEEHEDYQLVTIFQLASWPTEEEEAPTSITGKLAERERERKKERKKERERERESERE